MYHFKYVLYPSYQYKFYKPLCVIYYKYIYIYFFIYVYMGLDAPSLVNLSVDLVFDGQVYSPLLGCILG